MGAEISYGPNPAGAIGSINKLFKTLNDLPVCPGEGLSKLDQCVALYRLVHKLCPWYETITKSSS